MLARHSQQQVQGHVHKVHKYTHTNTHKRAESREVYGGKPCGIVTLCSKGAFALEVLFEVSSVGPS